MSRPYRDEYERDPRDARDRRPRDARDMMRDPRDVTRDTRESTDLRERRMDSDRMDMRDPTRIDSRTTRPATGTMYTSYPEQGRDDLPQGRYQDEPRERYGRAPIDVHASDRRNDTGASRYQDYFLPGEDIHREVIQEDICRYLGNDATVRPYTHRDVGLHRIHLLDPHGS